MPNLSDVRSSAYEFRNKDQAAIFDDVSAQSKLLPAPIKTAHLAATSPSFTQSLHQCRYAQHPSSAWRSNASLWIKAPTTECSSFFRQNRIRGGLQPTAAPLLRHQSSTGISLVSAGSTPPMSSPIMQRSPRLGPLSKLHHSLTSLSLISSSEDSAPSPFITAMTDLIGIAQQILDMDIAQLLTPNSCRFVINRILELQDVWNDHFDWPCKEYLVRLLMVFSTVARLVEHLEEDTRLWSSSLAPASNKQRGVPTVPGQGGRTPKSGWRRDSEMSGLGVELSENGDGDEEDNGGSSKVAESGTETGDSFREDYAMKVLCEDRAKSTAATRIWQSGNESADSSSGTPHLAPRSSIRDLRSRERSPSLFRQESLTLQEFRAVADEGQELNVLIEVGLDGKIAYVSPTVRAVFGYEPQECMVSETSEAVTISTLPFLSKENQIREFLQTQRNPSSRMIASPWRLHIEHRGKMVVGLKWRGRACLFMTGRPDKNEVQFGLQDRLPCWVMVGRISMTLAINLA
ncbi:hypothetical protein BC829DRAFT_91847 [Chytridium lagenaria]|nr:hypothetical protein BC829DRAFT_91847 [Chytridium lagenaria]